MTTPAPQRRGLGRGLGSLIPTAPTTPTSDPTPPTGNEGEDADTPESGSPGSGGPAPYAGGTHRAEAPAPASEDAAPATNDGPASQTGSGTAAESGAVFAELPVGQITPNPRQPRQVFEEEAMAELVHSIREIGLLQPVVVRPVGTDAYELIMGERRWRATQEAGIDTIPAIVRETGDTDMLRDALLENLHRSELNPLEEAAAYGQLLEDFGCTHDELAQRIGRSRPQISNTLRLLRLSPPVQRRVAAGVLSAGHARALLAVEDGDVQDRLAQRVVAEGISVRGLEEIVSLGDTPGAARAPRSRAAAPGLSEIADRLSDRLETRVRVDMGKTRGKITVDFATLEDLQRIIDIVDPRNRSDRPI